VSVRYTSDALRDLDQISSYIARQNVNAAADLMAAVETVVARLERFPRSAPETEIKGVRGTPALHFPYIIFYTVENHGITIHYVRHAARLRPWESED
jgi:addiction module RelE/StbE family toxin